VTGQASTEPTEPDEDAEDAEDESDGAIALGGTVFVTVKSHERRSSFALVDHVGCSFCAGGLGTDTDADAETALGAMVAGVLLGLTRPREKDGRDDSGPSARSPNVSGVAAKAGASGVSRLAPARATVGPSLDVGREDDSRPPAAWKEASERRRA
jgi:hypothetical protein